MSATLKLDKHELLWLAEGAMGKSHLRWDIYPMFVNTIFPQLNNDEREFIYAYLKRNTSWLWENKTSLDETPHQYWLQTLARYNPANQYKVTLKRGREKQIIQNDCYLWNGLYYTDFTRYCAPEYIKKVERKPYKKCKNSLCAAQTKCLRFLECADADKVIDNQQWACEKFDFIIEKSEKYLELARKRIEAELSQPTLF